MTRKGMMLAGLLGMALPMTTAFAVTTVVDDDPPKPSRKADRPDRKVGRVGDARRGKANAGLSLDRLFDGKETVNRQQLEAFLKGQGIGPDRLEKAAERLFDRLDTNNDGKLSRDEAKAIRGLERDRPGEPARPGGDRLFEAMANGKDHVGKGPFETYLKQHAPRIEKRPQAADKLFERLDDNHDGKLSRDELKKMPSLMERLRESGKKGGK